jgi:Leucine-rich repeat (LRR) protein
MLHCSGRSLHPLFFPLLLASCARSEVNLGDGGTTTEIAPRGARCADSTLVDGAVVAQSQEDLAALAGCEEIHGDFQVVSFVGADLTPLSALRSVEGELRLGARVGDPVRPAIDGVPAEKVTPTVPLAQQLDDVRRGVDWLTSLAGLESLESVGSLTLYRTSVPSLEPLSHLRNLGSNRTGTASGQLAVIDTQELRDLSGLEHAAGLRALDIESNDDLESLAGLNVPSNLDEILIYTNRALSDIDALAPLTTVGTFSLSRTGVENLDALSALSVVQTFQISNNRQLRDATGLSGLTTVTELDFQGNPALETLPSFSMLTGYSGAFDLAINNNDSLESVALDFTWGHEQGVAYSRVDSIRISDNKALVSILSPVGIALATAFEASYNPSLTELDLSSFTSLSELTVRQNPVLAQVAIPALQTVNTLVVAENPLLSTANFAAVRTFASTMGGNADDAPLQ